MKFGLKESLIQEICILAQKHDLQKIILFGSRARGDYKKTSDIDIAVKGGSIAAFCLDIEEETSTLLEYDVINLDKPVQEGLLNSINGEGVTLYEKI